MTSPCLVKEPYDSRTYRSDNVFLRKPEGIRRNQIQDSKKRAWDRHRGNWGTTIFELPHRGATHKDRTLWKAALNQQAFPPCSLKGHRHFGALAQPVTLLEGDVTVAEQGAAHVFYLDLQRVIMGNTLQLPDEKNSAAQNQRDLNKSWNDHETFCQPHTQACLEYATCLKAPPTQSTQQRDYVEHKTAYLYQPLPAGINSTEHVTTPFADKAKKQQVKYSDLVNTYYKELYKVDSTPKRKLNRAKADNGQHRSSSTTPTPCQKKQPIKRSRSAMIRAVTEATSTSEVSCSLAVLPESKAKSKTRGDKLADKITDAIANRQMNLKRSDLDLKSHVPPVQYFLSQTQSTQTESGVVGGLNPIWPPANKGDTHDKIGYPNLSLPLAINTCVHHQNLKSRESQTPEHRQELLPMLPVTEVTIKIGKKTENVTHNNYKDCVKTNAHKAYHKLHDGDWVPRIWDYNYLLFHLKRQGHTIDENNGLMSCHASHIDAGLIG